MYSNHLIFLIVLKKTSVTNVAPVELYILYVCKPLHWLISTRYCLLECRNIPSCVMYQLSLSQFAKIVFTFFTLLKSSVASLWVVCLCAHYTSFHPYSDPSVSGVSFRVWGACSLSPSRRQPPHTHFQQWWGASAVRHPSEYPGVSRSSRTGQTSATTWALK